MPELTRAPEWPQGASEMARRIREHDWRATPLGPRESWSERLRAMVEMMLASPLVSTLVWGRERVLLYNDVAAGLYGGRHPDVLGSPLAKAFPDSYPAVAAAYDRVFAGETVVTEAQPLDVSQGGGEVFDAYLTPVRDSEGRVVAAQMMGFEVGRRRGAEKALIASEKRQAFLLRFSDALRALSDPTEIMAEAARLLRQHFDAGWCYYVEWDQTGTIGHVLQDSTREGLPSMVGVHHVSDAPEFTNLLRSGQLLNVPDFASCPLFNPRVVERYTAIGIRSVLGPSLVKDGRLVATLSLADTVPRQWSGEDIEFVVEVAERTWATVERARIESALRESEERFRAIVETATDYAIFTTDAEGRIDIWPKGAELVFGWTAEEAAGRPMEMTYTPEDRAAGVPARERKEAGEHGQTPNVRWHQCKDGSRVFIDGIARRLLGSDGQLQGFVKVGQDVTERRATQEALRESEARFRQFGDASADVLWIRDAETLAFEYVSPAFEEIYGTPLDHVLGHNHMRRWAELILPEDRDKALQHIRRVRGGEHVLHAFRIRRADGEIRWIRDTSFPLLDNEGRVQRVAGIGRDVTEEVELQDRLRVLVAELQHRSRNLVSVVRGVAERTRATSTTLDDFRERFLARLDALGRVNALLSRLKEGDRVTFDQLLRTELAAHAVGDSDQGSEQVALNGPNGVRLRSASVQTFALAIHELATNALKHGALSRPEGRLKVNWELVPGKGEERLLRVDWRESGVPPPQVDMADATPRRQGYGRLLIERALPYQLQARTHYELGPDGVRCSILVPVSSTLDVAFSSHEDPGT